jgi:hypothetical protein
MLQKDNVIFWGILIILHLIFFSIQVKNKNYELTDTKEYIYASQNIKNYGVNYCNDLNKPFRVQLLTRRPPLYPLLILAINYLFNSNLALCLIQCLLSLFNIMIIRKLLLNFGIKKGINGIILLFIILSPPQLTLSNTIMCDILFQTFTVLIFYFFILFYLKREKKYVLWMNIIIILALLTKPVIYLLLIPNIILWAYFSYKEKVLYYLMVGMFPIFALMAYSYTNYQKTGYFHYTSISSYNMFQYNVGSFLTFYKGERYSENFIDSTSAIVDRNPALKDKIKIIDHASGNVLKSNIFQYSLYHLKGLFPFFLDPGRYDIYYFFKIPNPNNWGFWYFTNKYGTVKGALAFFKKLNLLIMTILTIIVLGNLLKLYLLIKFLTKSHAHLIVKLTVIFLIAYFAILSGPVSSFRYAIPVLPIIIFSAAYYYSEKEAV